MIKVGVVGCGGKLARKIIELIELEEELILEKAVTRKNGEIVNKNICEITSYKKNNVCISDDIMTCMSCDIIIDATNRDAFIDSNLDKYASLKKPLIIATTGFSSKDLIQIEEISKNFPIVHSVNYSFEFHYFLKAVKKFLAYNRDLDITIIEKHHRTKIDAPSGTAKLIKEDLRIPNISILSVRAGSIAGEHTIFIANQDGEEMEFTYRTTNRSTYAKGIIKIIPMLLKRENGLHNVQDFF